MTLLLSGTIITLVRFLAFPDKPDAPDWAHTIGSVLDNLLGAAVTSFVIGLAYVLLIPAPEAEEVEVVPSGSIAGLLASAAKDSTTWAIRARTASYFARVTLPLLTDHALQAGGRIAIRIQVLNPENEQALHAYALFRSNRKGASATWNVDRVLTEIYSTMLAAAVYKNEAPRLDIEIGLSPDFWVLSLDLSDRMAIVTGQNKNESCLCIRHTSQLFDGWRDDFDAGFSVCRVIRPTIPNVRVHQLRRPTQATLQVVREFFESLGFPGLSDANLQAVANYVKRDHNYA